MEMNTFPLSCMEVLWISPAVILDLGLPPSEERRPDCPFRQVHTLFYCAQEQNPSKYIDLHFCAVSDGMTMTDKKTFQKYKLFCSIISWCSTAPGRVKCQLPPRKARKCIPLWGPLLLSNPASSHLPDEHCSHPPQPGWDF